MEGPSPPMRRPHSRQGQLLPKPAPTLQGRSLRPPLWPPAPAARRGQASLEQLLVVGIGLSVVALLFFAAMGSANDNVRSAQGQTAVSALAEAVDQVNAMGPGSQLTVHLNMPDGARFVNISGNRIHLRVSLPSGDADFFANTAANSSGSIELSAGPQDVPVVSLGNGQVLVGTVLLTCAPTYTTLSFVQGGGGNTSFNVTSVASFNLTGINATLSGSLASFATLAQPAANLSPGASSLANLTITVPANQTTGAYTGTLLVNGSNSSECVSTLTVLVTRAGGADLIGPSVTALTKSPANPRVTSVITVNATGDDTATGNSSISDCQLELDSSGIWNDMSAADSFYNSPVENVTYSFGPIGGGNHIVRVRCIDSAGNIGNTSSISFFVGKNMLLVTTQATPDLAESNWTNWINTHSSGLGLDWGYDQVSQASVTGGSTNLSSYRTVVLAESPPNGNALYALLNTYRAGGNYVILLGQGVQNGTANLNVGGAATAPDSRAAIKVQTAHYISTGFTVGTIVTISTANQNIYKNSAPTITMVTSIDNNNGFGDTLAGANVTAYGPSNTGLFTANGDTFATRVLDFAINNSQ